MASLTGNTDTSHARKHSSSERLRRTALKPVRPYRPPLLPVTETFPPLEAEREEAESKGIIKEPKSVVDAGNEDEKEMVSRKAISAKRWSFQVWKCWWRIRRMLKGVGSWLAYVRRRRALRPVQWFDWDSGDVGWILMCMVLTVVIVVGHLWTTGPHLAESRWNANLERLWEKRWDLKELKFREGAERIEGMLEELVSGVWSKSAQERSLVFQNPGYKSRVPGTFREKYPANDLMDDKRLNLVGAFDSVFVITEEGCTAQWEALSERAESAGLRLSKIKRVILKDLKDSPLPVNDTISLAHLSATQTRDLQRYLGYLLTHRQIWDTVLNRKYSRVLVTDDTLFPTRKLLRIIPEMFNFIDSESVALRQPWHLTYFRRTLAESSDADIVESNLVSEFQWSVIPSIGRSVVQTFPSYGAGIYALSATGARFLKEHVRAYSAPFDAQLALMQKNLGESFVVLSPCNAQQAGYDRCADLVEEIKARNEFQCVWRRLLEGKLLKRSLDDME